MQTGPDGRIPLRRRLLERLVLFSYRGAAGVLDRTPPRLAAGVGGVLAQSVYLVWPARRRASRASYARVLGLSPDDPDVDRLTRRAYRNYARYLVDLMRLPGLPAGAVEGMVELSGILRFEEIRRASKAVIIVAAHLGNNEAAAAVIGTRGSTIHAVADDSEFRELYAYLEAQRAAWGVHLVPWRSLRAVYSVLRAGGTVVLLVDWGYRADGVPVRFFDAWTTLPEGPAILAARTGATIVPVVVPRLPDGRYAPTPLEPIQVASSQPAEIARATQAIATELEAAIRPIADQWYMFKPMWPTSEEERAHLSASRAVAWPAAIDGSLGTDASTGQGAGPDAAPG